MSPWKGNGNCCQCSIWVWLAGPYWYKLFILYGFNILVHGLGMWKKLKNIHEKDLFFRNFSRDSRSDNDDIDDEMDLPEVSCCPPMLRRRGL